MAVTREDLPKYWEFMYPILSATHALGGSGSKGEIFERVLEDGDFDDETVELTYGEDAHESKQNYSVFTDRFAFGLSYCKLSGALASPEQALYVLTPTGRGILDMDEEDGRAALREMDREVRRTRYKSKQGATDDDDIVATSADNLWKGAFQTRLHQLSPEEFEEFVLRLLRSHGMSLKRVGGTGDGGIDIIGSAPLGALLSSTVAVQCKRYDPSSRSSSIGRSEMALFQGDASDKGAERAIFVTLSRFSRSAIETAESRTPTVELIDGDRICDLALEMNVGIRSVPEVDEDWFHDFLA
jgi:restriction system protein